MSLPKVLLRIGQYLQQQHVLSLCCGAGNDLWCANSFYLYDAHQVAFWIMTESETRHGHLMQRQPQVAGTVNGQPEEVSQIQGVQYRGQSLLLENDRHTQVRAAYCQRFPVASKWSAPLWEIRLNELKMTDNTVEFGKKILWQRE